MWLPSLLLCDSVELLACKAWALMLGTQHRASAKIVHAVRDTAMSIFNAFRQRCTKDCENADEITLRMGGHTLSLASIYSLASIFKRIQETCHCRKSTSQQAPGRRMVRSGASFWTRQDLPNSVKLSIFYPRITIVVNAYSTVGRRHTIQYSWYSLQTTNCWSRASMRLK
jgi:hypothetical protein